ncbi:hypothetical protein PV327_007815 [Microctonus hyperodae]|uniref:Alpha-2-macroglobulin receptor-associated protein n=1 Tax=Microctonus hyperodae TaxID=165561 RepID=A0AA39G007_MICHY|nr:hypothetical protein PV327_007815 [Microctonus hyperodae]
MRYSVISIIIFISFCLTTLFPQCNGLNKYSAEANVEKKPNKISKKFDESSSEIPTPTSLKELDKPYRMSKLNLLWTKAKHRLSEPKLRSLFSDLKIHDAEELAYKHVKSDGKDPDGLEEAKLRKKLLGIMSTYGLLDHFGGTDDPELLKHHKPQNDGRNYIRNDVFNDERLNNLWAKAEAAGFTHEEMETLKEEFTHHQNKVDEYMSLLKDRNAGDPEAYKNSLDEELPSWNEIDHKEEESNAIPTKQVDYIAKANLLREKHQELKSGYDNLDILTAQGPNHQEFVEPKVQGLWRIAKQAQFTKDELDSLKEELHHYERRLLKLRHLHSEAALEAMKNGKDYNVNDTSKPNIKKYTRTIEKLHADIESRILERHTEL